MNTNDGESPMVVIGGIELAGIPLMARDLGSRTDDAPLWGTYQMRFVQHETHFTLEHYSDDAMRWIEVPLVQK